MVVLSLPSWTLNLNFYGGTNSHRPSPTIVGHGGIGMYVLFEDCFIPEMLMDYENARYKFTAHLFIHAFIMHANSVVVLNQRQET